MSCHWAKLRYKKISHSIINTLQIVDYSEKQKQHNTKQKIVEPSIKTTITGEERKKT